MVNIHVTDDWKELCRLNLETGTYVIKIFDYSENAYYSGIFTFVKNGNFKLWEIQMHTQLSEGAIRCRFAIDSGKLMASCNIESNHSFLVQYFEIGPTTYK